MIVEKTVSRAKKWLAVLPLALLTSGCDWVVMSPSGDIAVQQRDLVLISTGLMLLIIVPVICLTLFFAIRYRQSNKAAKYEPNWDHSVGLELLIWGIPLLIIIALGALTWTSTHLLDPYRPLGRIKPDAPTLANNVPVGNLVDKQQLANGVGKPLEVQVVALDWKWLFIYPEYGIATVNEPLPDDLVIGDECVLHPCAGRHDLHDAWHADDAERGHQQARQL
jgi:cytochrome o ubiquinol oxidase subunit 2